MHSRTIQSYKHGSYAAQSFIGICSWRLKQWLGRGMTCKLKHKQCTLVHGLIYMYSGRNFKRIIIVLF